MLRASCLTAALLAAAGCAVTPERQPPRPLAEDSPPQTYSELVTRARLQASAGVEAFYINRWADLEDAAVGLEQTARFLPKSTEVPPDRKDKLAARAGDLEKNARQLREAAKAREVKQTNESLQRVNLLVRELRPDS